MGRCPQKEPELHPQAHGVKSLKVDCAAGAGLIRPLIDTNRGPVNRPGPSKSPIAIAGQFIL